MPSQARMLPQETYSQGLRPGSPRCWREEGQLGLRGLKLQGCWLGGGADPTRVLLSVISKTQRILNGLECGGSQAASLFSTTVLPPPCPKHLPALGSVARGEQSISRG